MATIINQERGKEKMPSPTRAEARVDLQPSDGYIIQYGFDSSDSRAGFKSLYFLFLFCRRVRRVLFRFSDMAFMGTEIIGW